MGVWEHFTSQPRLCRSRILEEIATTAQQVRVTISGRVRLECRSTGQGGQSAGIYEVSGPLDGAVKFEATFVLVWRIVCLSLLLLSMAI